MLVFNHDFAQRYASVLVFSALATATASAQPVNQLESIQVIGTAEQELKESLGVSVLTSEEIEKNPSVSDLNEILRKEPGVNLTGNASSGMRGNRRQIDIRGMGPDNTMVLIDGKPANSRNASRQGWTGERDSDGDTNWVPPEAIERVEILRGPAAARYGSGAMGGVINIITKRPTDTFSGSISQYRKWQQDSKEGDSWRTSVNLAGPISDKLSFRVYGNYQKTQPDARDINVAHVKFPDSINPSGKTGLRDKNLNALLNLELTEQQRLELDVGTSRKSDLFSGDSQNANVEKPLTDSLLGTETTVIYRNSMGLSHYGDWDWGTSRLSATHVETRNSRLEEGLAGATEGEFNSNNRFVAKLKESRLSGEVNLPFTRNNFEQVLTLGGELTRESLNDPGTVRVDKNPSLNPKLAYTSWALFAEDSIRINQKLDIIPVVRLNHHQKYGNNVSPGLTVAYAVTDNWTLKGGVARAYKTPSMYQSNDSYVLTSRGNGCAAGEQNCLLQGNDNLKPETSLNKEIGIAYDDGYLQGSLAYFRNDYKNKISAGTTTTGFTSTNQRIYQWENKGKALVSGLEGNFFMPIGDTWDWNTNFTYMIDSKEKQYGQPLSIIPKYTINSYLRWFPTERWTVQANVTWYGKQKPADFDVRTLQPIAVAPSISPYALVGISSGYQLTKNLHIKAGIDNLFDKKLYREGLASGIDQDRAGAKVSSGARTYNQHGRAFFVDLRASF
ncbi:MAG TPA: FepA family TonB-dependent siderophore receptor [Candidatus Paenalcaligenes intestinipullorum]|uniref:FepA family TonB-dependent siderophore receptor n=1 Tax=Candidatus Paenalcaligenes intestinipullorum TaxID=2838718 RepID=A0A9D2RG73_9BURK|nr:FepA family TonB-dependent siderophore receptor [Candidatus Paenalcaligenes intestinipullorum]